MATHRIPLLVNVKTDTSDVFAEPQSVKGTNDFFDHLVWVFNDTSTKDTLQFISPVPVPENYSSGAKFVVSWDTTATTGDVEWDIDYRAIAAGESFDQATAQESLNQNDTAGGSAHLRQDAELSATDGNFASGDLIQGLLSRDGTDAGDTISAAVRVFSFWFEYSDA